MIIIDTTNDSTILWTCFSTEPYTSMTTIQLPLTRLLTRQPITYFITHFITFGIRTITFVFTYSSALHTHFSTLFRTGSMHTFHLAISFATATIITMTSVYSWTFMSAYHYFITLLITMAMELLVLAFTTTIGTAVATFQ